ncbi:BRCA2, helical [Musa troglodytarum]|uniref:BRCA2, helical n=1 Tax=Musa troglodytarum TaxID=320322 RepID=A0A9E7KRX6_9LILI|nr:BRCA2, helical [Musa troglodytarum]
MPQGEGEGKSKEMAAMSKLFSGAFPEIVPQSNLLRFTFEFMFEDLQWGMLGALIGACNSTMGLVYSNKGNHLNISIVVIDEKRCDTNTMKTQDGNEIFMEKDQELNHSGEEANQNVQSTPKRLNYHSYMNRPQSSRWSKAETKLFYEILISFITYQAISYDYSILPSQWRNLTLRMFVMFVMPRKQLNDVLDAELGDPDWASKLTSFDYEPLAAASIGQYSHMCLCQVHRPVMKNDLEVVTKIQHRGGAESDILRILEVNATSLHVFSSIKKQMTHSSALQVRDLLRLPEHCNPVDDLLFQKQFFGFVREPPGTAGSSALLSLAAFHEVQE